MKRMMVAVLGAIAISAVGVYAHAKPAPVDGSIYYGCLVPGSDPGSLSLINATEKGQKGKEKGNYRLQADPKLDAGHFVTNEVEVTGTVSGSGSSAVLTISKIKRRSDYCG